MLLTAEGDPVLLLDRGERGGELVVQLPRRRGLRHVLPQVVQRREHRRGEAEVVAILCELLRAFVEFGELGLPVLHLGRRFLRRGMALRDTCHHEQHKLRPCLTETRDVRVGAHLMA